MQVLGAILFVAVMLVFGVAVNSQYKNDPGHPAHIAGWVTVGIILVLGILAMLGSI